LHRDNTSFYCDILEGLIDLKDCWYADLSLVSEIAIPAIHFDLRWSSIGVYPYVRAALGYFSGLFSLLSYLLLLLKSESLGF
jgi:hypothetical protein